MDDCPVEPRLVDEVAYRTWRKWRTWAEREDIRQELWVWACARPGLDQLDEGKLTSALRDVAERYCRREKAQRSGYRPDDEAFYSLPLLRELIAATGEDGLTVRRGVDDSNTKIARRGAAGPVMEYETMVMDVQAGLAKAGSGGGILYTIYRDGFTYNEVGASWGMTEDQVNNAVAAAMRKLQRALGGRKPSMR